MTTSDFLLQSTDFIDNGDGTVTDKRTGLMWQRCAMGQTSIGLSFRGEEAEVFSHEEALALKSDFAGYDDWRIPNIVELQTIVNRNTWKPAIDTTVFPNTPNRHFWSSSPYAQANRSWSVEFKYGVSSHFEGEDYFDEGKNFFTDKYSVRLVRGPRVNDSSLESDFTIHQDGTVTHKRTGLMWQRCAIGQAWRSASSEGEAQRLTYREALRLDSDFAGYNDWRLPTADELLSIIDYSTCHPAINLKIFPNTPADVFWTSSPIVADEKYAWTVNFWSGTVGGDYQVDS